MIEYGKAEVQVIFGDPEDEGYLVRLSMYEPASYVEFAMKPDGLQWYLETINVFNWDGGSRLVSWLPFLEYGWKKDSSWYNRR